MNEEKKVDIVERAGDIIIFVMGIILLIGGNLVVLSRVFKLSTPCTEEILRNVFVWLIFLGTAYESKRGLVSVSILEEGFINKRKAGAYKALKVLHMAVCLIFAAFCAFYSFQMMMNQFATGEKSLVLGYLMGFVTLGIVLGCLLWTVYQGISLVRLIMTPAEEALPQPKA